MLRDLILMFSLRRDARAFYNAEARFSDSQSQVPSLFTSSASITFNWTQLNEEPFDSVRYSERLTTTFFADIELRMAWLKAEAFASGANLPLQVRFELDPLDTHIHQVRWELLKAPDLSYAISQSKRYLFARTLPSTDMQGLVRPLGQHLRIIAAIASPHDLVDLGYDAFDLADAQHQVMEIFTEMGSAELLSASPGGTTQVELIDAVLKGCDILYLMCHGNVLDNQPYICLAKEEGTSHIVSASFLIERLGALDASYRPRLIILASCGSSRAGHSNPLNVLGPRLALDGALAVIAFQDDVPLSLLQYFLPRFLEHLRQNGRIDQATAHARMSLTPEMPWWSPTLFLRGSDGRLWSSPPPEPSQPVVMQTQSVNLLAGREALAGPIFSVEPRVQEEALRDWARINQQLTHQHSSTNIQSFVSSIVANDTVTETDLLLDVLNRLNYHSQVQRFLGYVPRHRIAAFVISGPAYYGQEWLVRRLRQSIERQLGSTTGNRQPRRRVISFDLGRFVSPTGARRIWGELGKGIGAPGGVAASREQVLPRLQQALESQHIILNINCGTSPLTRAFLSQVIADFWHPLVEGLQFMVRDDHPYTLLAFLVDTHGSFVDIECADVDYTPETGWRPTIPIQLPSLTPFSADELRSWLFHTPPDQRPTAMSDIQTVVNRVLAECGDPATPEMVFTTICEHCHGDWQLWQQGVE